jgi:ComF family protein
MFGLYHERMLRLKHFSWLIDSIFPPRAMELIVRGATVESVKRSCVPAVITIETVTLITLFPYRKPIIQALINEAKYENNVRAQKLFGILLADYIKVSGIPENAVLVPLPLGKARRKERGYNQVEEIARFSGFPVETTLLSRARETVPQTTLGKVARKQNMSGAFGAAHIPDPFRLYILLDDVVTTGATLLAAHEVLQKAGAKHILLLALAH